MGLLLASDMMNYPTPTTLVELDIYEAPLVLRIREKYFRPSKNFFFEKNRKKQKKMPTDWTIQSKKQIFGKSRRVFPKTDFWKK